MSTNGYRIANCSECGKAFRTNRAHTTTCSDACRQKKYRNSKRKNKVGEGSSQTESVTGVTLSYLDWLVSHELSLNTPEDWQNV